MPPTMDVFTPWQSAHVGPKPVARHPDVRTETHKETAEKQDAKPRTFDELLRSRARTDSNLPVLYYPSSGIDYTKYTFQQLDVFTYRVAKALQSRIPMRADSNAPRRVVALLGPSNLEYLVTLMAVIKLGHTVLFLSTRISRVAIESLVKTTGTEYIIANGKFLRVSEAVRAAIPGLQLLPMPTRNDFEFPAEGYTDTQLDKGLDTEVETNEIVYIVHSSGSTGLPKPIYQRQNAALSNVASNMNMSAFITLPLYHNHGMANWYRAMYSRKPIHMYNAALPLTSDYLSKIIRANRFEIFYGVPYALKLLVESEDGIQLLARFKVVMYGGSACPDELGDKLVQNGVNLISHYGATEVGQLMVSSRPAGDTAWNYVRENDRLAPYLRWIPQGPNLYECCVLPGWPSKTATNMEDGSYRTKDLFEPHPTIPRAWKYIARADDTIVMVNGEKFNPVVTEGHIKSSPLVTEAVVFGAQQPYLGVLLVPSAATAGKSPAEVLDLVWPGIDVAQEANDAFAKLSKEMVVILPHEVDYPRTDKGSVIRQAFYRDFASEIELAYSLVNNRSSGARDLTMVELKDFLHELVAKTAQDTPFNSDTDFFALGLDSLAAIQMRAEILRHLKTDWALPQNAVFDHPSINKLSSYLLGSPDSDTGEHCLSIERQMQAMIEKFSDFQQAPGRYFVVTGVTGSLGAHLAGVLAQEPSVERVYCLVRASSREHAQQRTMESIQTRKVYEGLTVAQQAKLIALPSDLSRADLGLEPAVYQELASSLRAVVHSAWSVNFNLHLSSFEKDSIAGLRHLLALCQHSAGRSTAPAAFHFCSSVSAVARHPDSLGPVPEALAEVGWAQKMGYAHSKLVAEHICARAARAGVPVGVLRIGQIVADTVHGVWNATEAVPLLLQSARTIGALPALPERLRWLPVDVVARGVAEIALAPVPVATDTGANNDRFLLANVVNIRSFGWTEDLLPALRAAGLEFDEVAPREWVHRLRESDRDPVTNAPVKLVDFFARKYDHDQDELPTGKDYVTTQACAMSPALANAPLLDREFVKRFVDEFLAGAWKT